VTKERFVSSRGGPKKKKRWEKRLTNKNDVRDRPIAGTERGGLAQQKIDAGKTLVKNQIKIKIKLR
jgi:hypothetical protein